MKDGRMQCKDIPDRPVLEFIHGLHGSATWFWSESYKPDNSVARAMPQDISERLVLAKMRNLVQRGLVDGCACGCRGDFKLTEKGGAYLLDANGELSNVSAGHCINKEA